MEKVDLVDYEEDDTVEFSNKMTFLFNATKGLSGEEELYMPHLFILGMIYGTQRMKPNFLPMAVKAINLIFKNPESVFIKVKARDLLFDGLPIDCRVTDFPATAFCAILKENSANLQVVGLNQYRFSLFGHVRL